MRYLQGVALWRLLLTVGCEPPTILRMDTITRYALLEVLKALVVSLVLLTLLLTLGMGVREGLRNGLPPRLIVATMPYLLPEILGITVPVAMLFAVSNAVGRMAGSNEIVALKSLGISPMVIGWPILTFSLFVSVGTVEMYELSACWGRPNAERLVLESVEEIAYNKLRTDRAFRCSKFSIAVKRVSGRKLIGPAITIGGQDDHPTVTITAKEAEIITDRQSRSIIIRARNGQVDIAGQGRFSFEDTQEQIIPIENPSRPVHRDWLAMYEIPKFVAQLQHRAELLEEELEQRGGLSEEQRLRRRRELEQTRMKIRRLRTEPFRRWSNGFTCFCFALVGLPVAMRLRSDNPLTSFFLCFLPILAVYYPLLMFGDQATTTGMLPPVCFWTGNLLLIAVGTWMLRWVVRH